MGNNCFCREEDRKKGDPFRRGEDGDNYDDRAANGLLTHEQGEDCEDGNNGLFTINGKGKVVRYLFRL
jgi:hypothetical protein